MKLTEARIVIARSATGKTAVLAQEDCGGMTDRCQWVQRLREEDADVVNVRFVDRDVIIIDHDILEDALGRDVDEGVESITIEKLARIRDLDAAGGLIVNAIAYHGGVKWEYLDEDTGEREETNFTPLTTFGSAQP